MQRQRKLIALNLALLALLALVTLAPLAGAQSGTGGAGGAGGEQPRARGNYTIVAGEVSGQPAATLYILDSTNQELVALEFDRSRNQLELIGYRNLATDAARQNQRR